MQHFRFPLVGALIVGVPLMLGACATEPAPPVVYPQMTWAHMAPIGLNATGPEVIDAASTKTSTGGVVILPVDPVRQMRNWAEGRLKGLGTPGTSLHFIITEARAEEERLKKNDGFTGLITDENDARITMRLSGRLELRDRDGAKIGETRAGVTRTSTVKESLSLVEREALLYELLEKAVQDFNREMTSQIETHLKGFIIRR